MTGKVIAILPQRTGTSARGEWASQQFVIETQEQYPKHLCFEVFGADRIAQFNIQGGEFITVQFDIDAREYQSKWYNSIKAWNVTRQGQQQAQGNYQPQGGYQQPPQQKVQQMVGGPNTSVANPTNPNNPFPPKQTPPPSGKSDDLPF